MREAVDLTQGSIPRHIVRLSMPILGTSFLQMLYSFTDMAWLGRLSSEAVAAAGAASVFVWIAQSLSYNNKVGAEVTVANYLGAKNPIYARTFASHSVTLSLVMGLLILLIYAIGASLLLSFYQLKAPIHTDATTYLRIVAFGMPAAFMGVALTGVYNATGYPQIPFVLSAIGLVFNMLLDPLMIFTFNMGVAGAGWATILAQYIVLGGFLIQLRRDKILDNFPLIAPLQASFTKLIFKIGAPVAVVNALFAFINMSLGRIASGIGGHIGVLTLTVGGQLEGLCWNTAQGFSTALSTFTSQNYGAKNIPRIRQGLTFTLLLSLMIGIGGFVLYHFFPNQLFQLIVPDPVATSSGANYLMINSYAQIFTMIEVTFQGFFYGLRRSIPPSVISISGNLLRIPLAIFMLTFSSELSMLW